MSTEQETRRRIESQDTADRGNEGNATSRGRECKGKASQRTKCGRDKLSHSI